MHLTTSSRPRQHAVLDGIGASAHLLQARSLQAQRLHMDQACVVLVLAGRKTVYAEGAAPCVAHAGELMLMPPATTYGVANDASHARPYEAMALFFDDALVRESASNALATPARQARALAGIAPGFQQAVLRASALIQERSAPPTIIRHAALEVLTWMALAGSQFAPRSMPPFVDSLRALLARAPAQPWTAERAAALLHVSVATLRRRLAREHWTMTTLLLEVRLGYAMMLLQASDDYVGQVALDAGFTNHAHFSRLFKTRFGVTPSQLRQADGAPA